MPEGTLLTAVRLLRHGGVVVFPEGTFGAGDVADAQRGAVWLARTAGATMLPVAIRGTAGSRVATGGSGCGLMSGCVGHRAGRDPRPG